MIIKGQFSSFSIKPYVVGTHNICFYRDMSQLMRLWYLSHRRPANAQVSLGIHAVSPEPSLFTHMNYGSR